ncbi:hypothetical protein ACFE04_030669 [Oxalis oulophora]
MRLWQRAAGALKDKKSVLAASLSKRNSYHNPDLEKAIIKATSHNESYVDYRNAQRVFAWIRASPISLKPFVWALSNRMEKTKSWVVAIKGLMLMHGVFCCKTAAVQRIGRLAFDLSQFSDQHLPPERVWGFDVFVRDYFVYLDLKSSLFHDHHVKKRKEYYQQDQGSAMKLDLIRLEKLQSLLDTLLQIKPQARNMKVSLILEAMDCIIIEIFDVYSSICQSIAKVLLGIYSSGKSEAEKALKALQKATIQGEELAEYFEFCRSYGVFNAMEVPKVTQIPAEDIEDLKMIVNGVSENKEKEKSNVVQEHENENEKSMTTIVTNKWEVFEEPANHNRSNPFVETEHENHLPLLQVNTPTYTREVPDLITF